MASRENDEMLAAWSETNEKVVKFRREWNVSQYNTLPANLMFSLGRISSEDPEIGDEWMPSIAHLGPKGNVKEIFYVTREDNRLKLPILVRFRFMILMKYIVRFEKSEDIFCGITKNKKTIFHAFIEGKMKYLKEDCIHFALEMTIVTNPVDMNWYMKKNNEMMFHTLENDLSHDMGQLFIRQKSGDFTFKLGDKQLRASKNILAARSTVFAAMFDRESNFRENRENHTDIRDIDYEIFKEMLFYIYTGRVSKLHEMTVDEVTELLAAADRYQLENLKVICEEALLKIISFDNALCIYEISDDYNCSQLKFQTVGYIKLHEKEIREPELGSRRITRSPSLDEKLSSEISEHEEIPQPKDRKKIYHLIGAIPKGYDWGDL